MNKTSRYELCIIVPIYNEKDNMLRLEEALAAYLPKASVQSCVLFVNDGSKDNSQEYIETICKRQPSFFYINFSENKGLSAAIKAGIDITQSSFVGYIDADLQTTPEDFERLLVYRKEYEMVIGIRSERKDGWGKRLSSKIANSFRRMMIGDGIQDTGCPLKIMDSGYAKRIPLFTGGHRFLPALIQFQNGKVKQVAVQHFERVAGESKFNLWNRLIGPFNDCFAYRWMKKRYINYGITSENTTNS